MSTKKSNAEDSQDRLDSLRKRSPVAVAMRKRYGNTISVMRDVRNRRPNDARNSWRNEIED